MSADKCGELSPWRYGCACELEAGHARDRASIHQAQTGRNEWGPEHHCWQDMTSEQGRIFEYAWARAVTECRAASGDVNWKIEPPPFARRIIDGAYYIPGKR